MSNWTLFSNHGHVLVCLARDSNARLRDVAADVGITERAVQKIVRDLEQGGMVSVTKNGRRNRYRIHGKVNLRHNLVAQCLVGDLIQFVTNVPELPPPIAVRSIEPKPVRIISAEPPEIEPPEHERPADEPKVVEQPPLESQQVSTKKSRKKKKLEKHQGSLF